MKFINSPNYNCTLFSAMLNKELIGIYARSFQEAKQKAIEYFKPKKKEKSLIKISEGWDG